MTSPSATPGLAAPGKAASRSASRKAKGDQLLCPVCGVNPIEADETRCAICADKEMSSREGLHVGRNWLILLVVFAGLMLAGKWIGTVL